MVAVVELTCGVVAAAWLILLGIEAEVAGPAGRSLLDRSFPFLPGAAVGVGLAWMAVRSWRAANKEARQPAGPAPPQNLAAPAPSPARRAPDPLSPDGARELARAEAVLASAGVLAPHAPEPEQLREAVADHGEPVTADVVLAAMAEADWFRPSFRVSEYPANLAFHDSHGEQLAEVLRAQVEDIVRLAAGGLAGVSAVIEIRYPEDAGRWRPGSGWRTVVPSGCSTTPGRRSTSARSCTCRWPGSCTSAGLGAGWHGSGATRVCGCRACATAGSMSSTPRWGRPLARAGNGSTSSHR
jgi:hypothetical protein